MRPLRRFALATAVLAIGCSSGTKSGSPQGSAPSPVTASPAFAQTDAATGVAFSAPAGAYDASAARPTFAVTRSAALPSGVTAPAGATQGPVYAITDSYGDSFLRPVSVTVPYDPAVNALPTVLHWNGTRWEAAQVSGVDAAARTATFGSVTFSPFSVMSTNTGPETAVDTGFKPTVDGFQIPNFGAYATPGQSSLAMSTFAAWYYASEKATQGKGLYALWQTQQALAANVVTALQKAQSQVWASQWRLPGSAAYRVTPDETGRLLIANMALTGQPQVLLMKSASDADNQAIAVLVYKWAPDCTTSLPPVCSTTAGKFFVYDPDFPGETQETTIAWVAGTGAGTGFSGFSKASAYRAPFVSFAFDGLPSYGAADQFKTLFDNLTTGTAQTAITLTSPSPIDVSGTYTQTITGATLPDVTIGGTVTGNATDLTYTLNGGPLMHVAPQGGAFSFVLKGTDLKSENTVTFTAGPVRTPYSFTAFKSLIVRFVGTSVGAFQNFGFETGDKTGWSTETHLWTSNTDVALTSPTSTELQRNLVGCPFTKATAASHGTYDTCDFDPDPAATPLPACTSTSQVGDLCYNPDWGAVIAFNGGTYQPWTGEPPEKSAVVGKTTVFANPDYWYLPTGAPVFTAGIDPVVDYYQQAGGDRTILGQIANLPVVFNGSWALRVNNEDNAYHASTAAQTTTLPATVNELRFAWAAVLEDPSHLNSYQPFVEVRVTDDDAHTILYRKFFFSGNPEYTGWVKLESPSPTATRWNVIPWQKVTITGAPVVAAQGHKVTIRVYASDCMLGGHGGYAYLDDAP